MRSLIDWLIGGSPYRVVARGRLSVGSYRWAAVPSRQARAFKDANRGSLNALSFAHFARGMAARFPETADRAGRAAAEVERLEVAYPQCVIFVLTGFDID